MDNYTKLYSENASLRKENEVLRKRILRANKTIDLCADLVVKLLKEHSDKTSKGRYE